MNIFLASTISFMVTNLNGKMEYNIQKWTLKPERKFMMDWVLLQVCE